MALGGGTFLVQNKVLPGAYINFVSRPRAMGHLGERGVLCMGMELDWGADGMITVEAEDFQKETKAITILYLKIRKTIEPLSMKR